MGKENIIELHKLTKKFGDFTAVNNVNLEIKQGEIYGLLGPNGAGKTTTINMILGLLRPTDGTIFVNGLDSRKHEEGIKSMIGFMTQETVVDGDLTGRQNVDIYALLYHVPSNKMDGVIKSALEEANLTEFADKKAMTYSGGMQRRLALVRSMVHDPKILILDEPTTGLDVQNRASMWNRIRELRKEGVTVILTTQYLEEADTLCDRIAIIDHGKIVALGTVSELKALVGSNNVVEIVARMEDIERVVKLLKSNFNLSATVNSDKIEAFLVREPMKTFKDIVNALATAKIPVLAISMHLPTLDDVFLKITGATMRDSIDESATSARSMAMARRR